jgi:hypothetical protein
VILDHLVFLPYGVLLVADFPITAISYVVASVSKTSLGPHHPMWKCIGGGAHGPYHPAKGGQGGYIIGGAPHDLCIVGLIRK